MGFRFFVDMENRPFNLPAQVIETVHWHGTAFLKSAKDLREVTTCIEYEGVFWLKEHLRCISQINLPGSFSRPPEGRIKVFLLEEKNAYSHRRQRYLLEFQGLRRKSKRIV